MNPKKLKKVPRFKSAGQEGEYWETHSVADHQVAPVEMDEVLAELAARHRAKQNVTLRLEPELTKRLKKLAHRAGVKYQTFVREWLWRAVA